MNNIKQLAYTFLKENKIKQLPIPISEIAHNNKWAISTYGNGEKYLKSIGLWEYARDKKGLCLINSSDNSYTIFIEDTLSYTERKLVISHEIGHIVLKHTALNDVLGNALNAKETNEQESEADIFALALLAPVPILLKNKISTQYDIECKTGLSRNLVSDVAFEVEAATPRHKLQRARRRNKIIAISIIIILTGFFIGFFAKNAEKETATHNKIVSITPSGEKYHKLDCNYVKYKKIQDITIIEAIEKGKTPCKRCKPLE